MKIYIKNKKVKTKLSILAAFLFWTINCNHMQDNVALLTTESIAFTSALNGSDLNARAVQINTLEANGQITTSRSIQNKTAAIDVFKVSFQTNHPDGSGKKVTASGVVLLPRACTLVIKNDCIQKSEEQRIRVIFHGTQTHDSVSPSVYFNAALKLTAIADDISTFPYNKALETAASHGFAVFAPDYIGFGDSKGCCFHPFVNKKSQTKSNIDFFNAAKIAMEAQGYKFKKDIFVEGYSQGAFVAVNFARTLETDTSQNTKVKLLSAGGTPALFIDYFKELQTKETHDFQFFFPYIFFGFTENNLLVSDPSIYYNPEWLSTRGIDELKTQFDGNHAVIDVTEYYQTDTLRDFLSEAVLSADVNDQTGPFYDTFKTLEENSLETWNNQCEFRMYHSPKDNGVYYAQAKQFFELQSKKGSVSFTDLTLNGSYPGHLGGFQPWNDFTNAWFIEKENSSD